MSFVDWDVPTKVDTTGNTKLDKDITFFSLKYGALPRASYQWTGMVSYNGKVTIRHPDYALIVEVKRNSEVYYGNSLSDRYRKATVIKVLNTMDMLVMQLAIREARVVLRNNTRKQNLGSIQQTKKAFDS